MNMSDSSKEAEETRRMAKLLGVSTMDESSVLAELQRSKRIQLLERSAP